MSFISRNHPQQVAVRGPLDEVDDRTTPQDLWDQLHAEHRFDLDVAAAPHNAKTPRYYTRQDDGLQQPWDGRVWCNPPYSNLDQWVAKAWQEWRAYRAQRIVMLLPANRTEQGWWQDQVEPHRDGANGLRTEFLRGRLRFIRPGATEVGPNERPPFGCVLLTWARRSS